jgi:transmembrane sensor
MLVFDRSTLAEAVAEFNRYNRKKLVIEGEDTADVRIGGSFEADNIDAFGRLLEEAFGLSVENRGDEIVISG